MAKFRVTITPAPQSKRGSGLMAMCALAVVAIVLFLAAQSLGLASGHTGADSANAKGRHGAHRGAGKDKAPSIPSIDRNG